jgi:hypothetical protein
MSCGTGQVEWRVSPTLSGGTGDAGGYRNHRGFAGADGGQVGPDKEQKLDTRDVTDSGHRTAG